MAKRDRLPDGVVQEATLRASLKNCRVLMLSIEQLTQEVLALPSVSRALLAEKLIESLEFDIDPQIQTVWLDEAKKRRGEILSGAVQPIEGDDALAQVRRLLSP